MAAEEKKVKRENFLVRYFRETVTELRKVRWPSRRETWTLTKVVLAVTFGMAFFLWILDFLFGQLLSGVVRGDVLYYVLGAAMILLLLGSGLFVARNSQEV